MYQRSGLSSDCSHKFKTEKKLISTLRQFFKMTLKSMTQINFSITNFESILQQPIMLLKQKVKAQSHQYYYNIHHQQTHWLVMLYFTDSLFPNQFLIISWTELCSLVT